MMYFRLLGDQIPDGERLMNPSGVEATWNCTHRWQVNGLSDGMKRNLPDDYPIDRHYFSVATVRIWEDTAYRACPQRRTDQNRASRRAVETGDRHDRIE
jgi:hypothetical protein